MKITEQKSHVAQPLKGRRKILGFIEAETMYIERGRKWGYKNVASSRGGWGRYSRPLINLLAPEGGGGRGCQLQVYQLAEPKPEAKFLVPVWGDIVDPRTGLSYRHARLYIRQPYARVDYILPVMD